MTGHLSRIAPLAAAFALLMAACGQAQEFDDFVREGDASSLADAVPTPREPGIGDAGEEGLFDNLSFFGGLAGSKQPQDLGVNAHFGGAAAVNAGFPLLREWGVGAQLGTTLVFTDHAVQVVERIEGSTSRFQNFTTAGVFQRTDAGLNWGLAYDFLTESTFEHFQLGQWRGLIGYRPGPRNEFGTWFAISDHADRGSFGATAVVLDPITQGNLYWRHTWPTSAQTTLWAGIAEGHGEVNVALGDFAPVGERLVFGADIFVPLNSWVALFGEANFISPADTGTVDAYLGLAFYPGGRSFGARERRFAPVLPVANTPTFAVDLAR